VPRFAFLAAMGGVIARGEPHRWAFELVRPGIDLAAARRQRIAEGWRYEFRVSDFYPDAPPCLRALRERGFKIGIAGNQLAVATAALAASGIAADFMVMSQELGVEKPDRRFFEAIVARSGENDPSRIAYVGDRLDNDVIPAMQAGMRGVFIRRGPWAFLWPPAERTQPDLEIQSLTELPRVLRA
jgi:HAD superfamily hydrolase (TIGR01549 family)